MKDLFEHNELTREKMSEQSESALNIVQNMSKTIDDFRQFFKPERVKESFDVSSVIKQAISLIAPTMEFHSITINFHDSTKKLMVRGFPREFCQVLLVIINNSKDAILEADNKHGNIGIHTKLADNWIELSIIDDGVGIPDTAINNIFDPYFTTKDVANGTGIGLYMGKMIIMEHMAGEINLRNRQEGTECTIRLPLNA